MIFHVQDEAFERAAAKIKHDLSGVHKLLKEVDDIQGAPSLQSRKHSKAKISLEAFMVIHILHITDFVLS